MENGNRIESLFDSVKGSNNYRFIEKHLEETEAGGGITKQELLDFFITYFDHLTTKTRNVDWVLNHINKLLADESIPESIRKDAATKFDTRISEEFEEFVEQCSSTWSKINLLEDFKELPVTKKKIKESGKDILYRFHIPKEYSVEQVIMILKDVFGKGDFNEALEYYFRCNEGENAELCIQIAKELLKHTTNPEEQRIVHYIGRGNTNHVYQVGSYVLKLGTVKNISRSNVYAERMLYDVQMDRIPNSRYIVQPIIRQYINRTISGYGQTVDVPPIDQEVENGEGDFPIRANYQSNLYIEVQNLLDMDWQQGKTADEIMDIIEMVFENLLSENLLSYDMNNIGRLRKRNTSHIKYQDVIPTIDGSYETDEEGHVLTEERELKPTQEGIRMTGHVSDDNCLQAGDYVLADTEYVVDLSQYDEKTRNEKIQLVRKRLQKLREELKLLEEIKKKQTEKGETPGSTEAR